MKKNCYSIGVGLLLVGLCLLNSPHQAYATDSPTIVTTSLPAGVLTTTYSATVSGAGTLGDYFWRVSTGALPDGLKLTQQTNCITSPCQMPASVSGTPTRIGEFTFTLELTSTYQDSITTATQQFVVAVTTGVVDSISLSITTGSPLPSGTVWVPYSSSVSATGGSGTYTWSLKSGTLPAGISLSSGNDCATAPCQTPAQILGTPTVSGTFPITIQVSAKASASGPTVTISKDFTLVINSDVLTISTESPLPPGTVGSAYSTNIMATGGNGAFTWYLISGSMPNGLGLTYLTNCSACQSPITVSGTPSVAETSTFTLKVATTTPSDMPSTKEFSITIAPAVAGTSSDSTGTQTTTGNTITNPEDGSLILDKGAIFIIENGLKRPFASMDVFNGLGFKLNHVITGDISGVNLGDGILSPVSRHTRGSLIISSGVVYFLGKDLRYPFPSAEVFLSWNNKFENIVSANSSDLSVPLGDVVQKKQ